MKRIIEVMIIATTCLFVGCASKGKVILDSSPNRPSWVGTNTMTWQEDGKLFLKAIHTVRGNERLNGCYDLAKLDAKEQLLGEIANDVKGSLDNAQESISEQAEVVLTKVRSSEYEGQISGLRFSEQYFERYQIGDNERIDCHVLSEMTTADYNKTKQAVVNKVVAVDPRIKEAIAKKNINFFNRAPASGE